MSSFSSEDDFYVDGGTMLPDAGSYVERSADGELLDRVRAGEFCYILTCRQVGKSSLVARAAVKLREENIHAAIIDLSQIGTKIDDKDKSAGRWYYGLARRICRELGIGKDLKAWWRQRDDLPAIQRLTEFFSDVVLAGVEGPVVVFIDEIDTTINIPFTDDFFAAIRWCYNARATEPGFARLTFVLLGVASPDDLIADRTRTPFNIGTRIELTDFKGQEAEVFAEHLGEDSQALLNRILHWTGGHPYLTQKLCKAVVKHQRLAEVDGSKTPALPPTESSPSETGAAHEFDALVDGIVTQEFLTASSDRNEDNLSYVRNRLIYQADQKAANLRLYRRIRSGRTVEDNPLSSTHNTLKLSGIVKASRDRFLQVRNRVYEAVFNPRWIRALMPVDWTRRVAVSAVVLLLLSPMFWYEVIYPRSLIATLEFAREDYELAEDAYQRLRNVPFYGDRAESLWIDFGLRRMELAKQRDETERSRGYRLARDAHRQLSDAGYPKADELYASFFEQRARRAERERPADEAGLWWLTSLAIADTEERRRAANHWLDSRLQGTFRHADNVTVVAFSPQGDKVLTGGGDYTARLWDVATGRPLGEPMSHRDRVSSVAFSPQGDKVLTGGYDNTARIWDASTGQPLVETMRHEGPVEAVAFSPQGDKVMTGENIGLGLRGGGAARLWDATTGELLGEPMWHKGRVTSVAFSPQGDKVLTGSYDNTARLWEAVTGKPLGEPMRHEGSVVCVAFSPQGDKVLTGSADETARLWDAATGKSLGEVMQHERSVVAVAFSPQGDNVLTGSEDNTGRLWDATTGRSLGEAMQHERSVVAVAFNPHGDRVVTGSLDNTARLWDATTGKPLEQPMRHEGSVLSVAFSPLGDKVLAGSSGNTARLWDATTGKPLEQPMRHEGSVHSVAFSPLGDKVLTGSEDYTARLWDARTGKPVGESMRHEGSVLSVAFCPQGDKVITGSADKTACLWDASTGMPLGVTIPHHSPVEYVAFAPRGDKVLTASHLMAYFWDATSGTRLGKKTPGDEGGIISVAFSPQGDSVFTGNPYGSVRMWDASTGMRLHQVELERSIDRVNALAVNARGNVLFTGSDDNTAQLWRIPTGESLGEAMQHEDNVLFVAFSPQGGQVLTVTRWRINLSRWDSGQWVHIATRQLPGSWIGHSSSPLHWVEESENQVDVAVHGTPNPIQIARIRFDQYDDKPIHGDAAQLLDSWQRRLALKIDKATAEFTPYHPIPSMTSNAGRGVTIERGEKKSR